MRARLPWVLLLIAAPLAQAAGEASPPPLLEGAKDWRLAGLVLTSQRGGLGRFKVKAVPAALLATVPEDARGDGPPDGKTLAYDFDGDGTPDLVTFSRVMYGPSDGFLAYLRDGATLKQSFALSGDWKDLRVDAKGVTLRFEANVLQEGEARFSTTLRFDRATHRWQAPLVSYHALQGKIPAPGAKPEAFVTAAPTELRSTPARVVTDGGVPDPSYEASSVLEGNVLARFPAQVSGVLLGRSGAYRFVAFPPASAPSEKSLSHGMNGDDGATPWLCGWIERP